MQKNAVVHPAPVVRKFIQDFLLALGANDEEAAIVGEGLITACLWWHPGQGQGLEKLLRYHRRVKNGGIVPGARMTWVKEGPAHALLDAAQGFGYVAAHRAMERAIQKAQHNALAIVGVRNSNHFGIAGYHAQRAARAGVIGWAMTNAGAEMAPPGSARPVLGTNPWGIAIPRKDHPPIVLDMALTMSGKGMMRWYQACGLEIPESWALTPEGQTTSDPSKAMEGPLLPIGDYKGYGLSLVTDVLAGVMTGALFGLSVFKEDTHFDVGHVMIAVSPEAFLSKEAFYSRLETLLKQVKDAPPIDPAKPILLPGEREQARQDERLRTGVPLDPRTLELLRELAAPLGVSFPFELE